MSSERPLSKINFFLCSTYLDLRAHRDAVIKQVISRAGVINAQEFFGARDQKPLQTCLEEVTKSHVFLMFLGPRYGSIDLASQKSFVEHEYEKAKELGLLRLAYIIDDTYPFPIEYVSTGEDAAKLRRFKEVVRSELTVDLFTSPDDLSNKVYKDLLRELPKREFTLGEEISGQEDSDARVLIKNFLALPKLFYGRNIRLRVRFHNYSRAQQAECDAFSLRYGAALKRRFVPVDKSVAEVLHHPMAPDSVLAQGQDALELIRVPKDVETAIVVKTIQGEYVTESPVYGFLVEPGWMSAGIVAHDRHRVVVDYKRSPNLICGFELVELS